MANLIYCRVSTSEQTVANQIKEITDAGYEVEDEFIFSDEVSGATPFLQRAGFQRLLAQCRRRDTLIVNKLDRLGRDQLDVQQAIQALQEKGVGIIVLQLGKTDLASSAGRMIVSVLAAVAQMERDLIRERTLAGLARARQEGRKGGRPKVVGSDRGGLILDLLRGGESVRRVARQVGCSPTTVMKIKKDNGNI